MEPALDRVAGEVEVVDPGGTQQVVQPELDDVAVIGTEEERLDLVLRRGHGQREARWRGRIGRGRTGVPDRGAREPVIVTHGIVPTRGVVGHGSGRDLDVVSDDPLLGQLGGLSVPALGLPIEVDEERTGL